MRNREVREETRARVLGALVAAGRSTRGALVKETGLSKATISRYVEQLSSEAIVREAEAMPASGRGPRRTAIELVAEAAPVCGIDLGATNVRLALIDLSGRLLRVERKSTPRDFAGEALADWLADAVEGLGRTASAQGQPWAVVVGVPGVVNPSTGLISGAPNLGAVEGEAFANQFNRRLPDAAAFDNDANLALLGELYFGAARGSRTAVMFTIGTGVGAGVAVDGRLYRGRSGFAGELGYLLVGPDLTFEQAVAGPGLLEQARRLGLAAESPSQVIGLAASPAFGKLRESVQTAYLTALSAAICAFEPEVIVLGGGLAAFVEPWLDDLRGRLIGRLPWVPPILRSELGDMAGTYGALAVGLERAYGRLGLQLDGLNGVSAVERLAALAPALREA